MFVKQLYTPCLSEAAYFICSEGEAVVIDPLRDIESYIKLAEEHQCKIKYIFETHFHADFVSGHIELSKLTGAPIIYGPGAETDFIIHKATDGEKFSIGKCTIQAVHTPGHTIESTCYLLFDEEQVPKAIFTGDTLFVGDVGRPDLSSGDMTSEELAGIMYDTLHNKILTLPDGLIVYPGHGAGSSCGKDIGSETHSTIGEQKKFNYALQPQSKEDFIKAVTSGLSEAPVYFSVNAKINKEGYGELTEIKKKGMTQLSVNEVKEKIKENVIVLDTRPAEQFTEGFIPGSIFIGLEGRFAEWSGSLLPFHHRMILITEEGKEEETIIRLARVGFDKVEGYLKGSFNSWEKAKEPIDMIISVESDELAMDLAHDPKALVIDVRREAEFADGHVKDAVNLPLNEMTDVAQIAHFEDDQNLYIHCAGGYRSVIATSLMKRQGVHNLRNIIGGWERIKDEKKIPTKKEVSVLN